MNKLGLAQSYVDTDLHIGFSLNEGAWTLRLKDRRSLLHKLSPFLGTDSTENVISAIFGADGCVLNIYSANPEAGDGYFATHVFIPTVLCHKITPYNQFFKVTRQQKNRVFVLFMLF